MVMSTPVPATLPTFEQYQQWVASQTGQAQGPIVPEELPPLHIGEVLKGLVNSARLASEALVREYHRAIDAAFPPPSDEETDTTATAPND